MDRDTETQRREYEWGEERGRRGIDSTKGKICEHQTSEVLNIYSGKIYRGKC